MSDYRPEEDDLAQRLERAVADFPARPIALAGRKAAAVALTLLPDEEGHACFLLTRRARGLRRHSGQFALPGGRLDPGEDAVTAALRELEEEVGLAVARRQVAGRLDDYATRSGFVITPIVVVHRRTAALRRDPQEVAKVFRVPLRALDRPETPKLTTIPQSEHPVLSIPVFEHYVHSPTAAIVYQLFELALHERVVRVAHYEQPLFAWR